jgi:hypothetical protein
MLIDRCLLASKAESVPACVHVDRPIPRGFLRTRNFRVVTACAILSLGVLGCSREQPTAVQKAVAEQPIISDAAPRRFALLVGIDSYRNQNIRKLHGCKNDVKAMKSVLVGRYKFPEKNVHVLLDEQAGYKAIVDEFKSFLIANATRSSDIVVFHFSGHGSRSPDAKSPSGFAETIVPYDSRDRENLDLTAKALSSMVRELAKNTKNITVSLDSCNSGRMIGSRGLLATTEVRSIPAATSPAPAPPFPDPTTREIEQAAFSPLDDSYVLLAAALAKEDANEYIAGDTQYGAFSFFLTQELQRARDGATYDDVMDAVRVEVSEKEGKQNPQVVGPNHNHELFGTKIVDTANYLLVVSSAQPAGKVFLPYAGEPHGITKGSTYDVYAPDVNTFGPPNRPTGMIQIEDVSVDSSIARITSGGPITDYSRAVLRDFKLSDRKLRVWVQKHPQSNALSTAKTHLQRLSQIELTDDRNAASLLVSEANNKITLSTPDGEPLSTPIPSTSPGADNVVAQQVLRWVNWFYMLSLENPSSGLDVSISISPEGSPVAARGLRSLAQIGKADNIFHVGEKALVVVTNHSTTQTLYVTVLVLSSDRTISVLLPDRQEQGAAVELKPGGSISPAIPPAAFLPKCLDSTVDSFKVIATSNPISLQNFVQERGVCDESASRSVDELQDDLNQLLKVPDLTTRGFGQDPGAWTSVRKVVEVRR